MHATKWSQWLAMDSPPVTLPDPAWQEQSLLDDWIAEVEWGALGRSILPRG